MTAGGRKIAIVGGGMSGMAAAIVLARHGVQVTILEKRPQLGPTLRGFSRQGAHFETGLHYAGELHEQGVLARYLRLLGLDSLEFDDFSPDNFDRVRFPLFDKEIAIPTGHAAIVDAFSHAFPPDRRFIASYFQTLRETFLSSAYLNFDDDIRSEREKALASESLSSVLRKGTEDPLLRTALSVHTLLYGVSPEEVSFLQHARIAGSYLEGVKTVAGGGNALVEALAARLRSAGVEILCGLSAAGLEFSPQGLVRAVRLDNEQEAPADGVLFTAHPVLLPPMLPQGAVKPAFLSRLRKLEDTFSAHTLFGKSRRPVPLLQGGNLFLCPGTNLDNAFAPDCTPEKGPFYVTSSARNAQKSASGHHGVLAFAPANPTEYLPFADSFSGRRPPAYANLKCGRLEQMRKALMRLAPELAPIDFLDGGTPLTNRDFLSSPGCGLYGTRHSLHQFNPLPATRIPNLWMAGQSVIAPGILGTIISAFVACSFILGRDAVQKELFSCA